MRPFPIIVDLLIVALFVVLVNVRWESYEVDDKTKTFLAKSTERQIAASAIKDELTAGVTVSSILLVAVGALLSMASHGGSLDSRAKHHLRNGSVLCVLSLLIGLWALGSLPTLVNLYNVAQHRWIASLAISQVGVTMLGAARVIFGLFVVLR